MGGADSKQIVIVLEVTSGPHTGQRFEFDRHDTFLVGRSSRAQLCLNDDAYFSRNHFRIEVSPPRCYLVDLGSNNGTKVNGRRVRETFLADGDIISGGRTEIVVRVTHTSAGHVSDSSEPVPADVSESQILLPGLLSDPSQTGSTSHNHFLPKSSNYEIVSELGRGAMGVVYRAIHKPTRQQVAVKLMLPGVQATPSRLQLFAREASILSQLSHPYIIRFLELGTADDYLFIVAEYVDTIPLRRLLEEESRPSQIRICCGIACRVLKALEYAHSLSLVHRDIKPANILLSRQGRKLHTRIADFGLAKNYEDAGLSEMTKDGEVRGSPAYMSPEQIISSRYAKPACDLYSVGVTLYEFLCGKLPFDTSMGLGILRAILEDPPTPVQTYRSDIPRELAAVIERSLAKDSADRFQSAEEMYEALIPFSRRETLRER
jgi:eukaryotic-like serine/threonine-protein kinase